MNAVPATTATTATAPVATTATTVSPKPVQSPLTLVMTVKSPEAAAELEQFLMATAALPEDQNPIHVALQSIGTVHFARFSFLDNKTKFAIITTFDGSFQDYLKDFAGKIGPVFDKLFTFVNDAPPAPVSQHPDEFMAFVQANDAGAVSFYSAYPTLKALDIIALAEN